jgi:IS1 family transposase
MNRLDIGRRAHVVKCLVEGMSLRATARVTGVARMTVEKLLRDLGTACVAHHDATVRNVAARRIQADEIWSFCYAKAKHVTPEMKIDHPDAGDVWTWTAMDSDSKLMLSYLVGPRRPPMAYHIIRDLHSRVTGIPQITTDGLPWYAQAIDRYFGIDVHYGIIQKIYAADPDGRYSPPICIGCKKTIVTGDPDPDYISTSHVERSNLTMRMSMRRFTRLTNAFSKKVEMHRHSVALHFTYYNFVQIHGSLRVTPAMAAGIETRAWDVSDIVSLVS